MNLLLIGAGWAHIELVKRWRPVKGCRVIWLTEQTRSLSPQRLPRWISGLCEREALYIDLKPLAERARIELVADPAVSVDLAKRVVRSRSGKTWAAPVISIATGGGELVGPQDALPMRPFGQLLTHLERSRVDWYPGQTLKLAHIGAGASGVEYALNMATYLRTRGIPYSIHLIEKDPTPMGLSSAEPLRSYLAERHIELTLSQWGKPLSRSEYLVGAQKMTAQLVTHSLSQPPPSWLQVLPTAGDRIQVRDTLEVVGHAGVFVAGDLALTSQNLPRSGLVARAQGKHLARNLRAQIKGRKLKAFHFRGPEYYLITTGEQTAFLQYRGSLQGPHRWWYRLRQLLEGRQLV